MTRIKNIYDYADIMAVGLWVAIIAAYYGGTQLGQLLVLESNLASPIWPPSGIAIAAILRWGYRVGPAIFIGALISGDWGGSAYLLILASGLISTLEPLACVWLIRSFIPEPYPFNTAKNVLIYCAIGLLVIFFSATFEVGINLSTNLVQPKDFGETWYIWYLGNYTGFVVVAPLLLTWIHKDPLENYQGKLVELAILGLFLLAALLLIFGGWLPDPSDDYSVDFVLLPILLWVAYRFQIVGTTAAVSLMSIIAIWGTINGHGPFVEQTAFESELILQNFTLVITITLLVLSAVLKERDCFEFKLVSSEKRYHDFISNSTEGIWRLDFRKPLSCKLELDKQVDWIFEYGFLSEANDVFARKWGFSTGDQLIGTKFSDLLPSNEYENREAIRRFVDSGYKLRNLRTTGAELDNNVRYFSAHITGHVENDYLVYVWAIVTDITDRVHLDNAKKKSREQELQLIQANKMGALGVLISGVAHEVNNPNNLVLLNAQMLTEVWTDAGVILDQHYREDPDALLGGLAYSEMHKVVPELISDIADSATRVKNIVGNLKDFARPGGAAEISDVDLNLAVARVLQLLRHFIQKKTRHIHTDYTDDLPTIKGDYQKIEQIIVNLVMNALESLPNIDRAVTVSTELNDTETHLEVRIRDEGVGIPPEDLDKLFDAFFTTKQAKGGTGLGLEISAMLVREHGGTISFDSELGKGTEVVVRFPV